MKNNFVAIVNEDGECFRLLGPFADADAAAEWIELNKTEIEEESCIANVVQAQNEIDPQDAEVIIGALNGATA